MTVVVLEALGAPAWLPYAQIASTVAAILVSSLIALMLPIIQRRREAADARAAALQSAGDAVRWLYAAQLVDENPDIEAEFNMRGGFPLSTLRLADASLSAISAVAMRSFQAAEAVARVRLAIAVVVGAAEDPKLARAHRKAVVAGTASAAADAFDDLAKTVRWARDLTQEQVMERVSPQYAGHSRNSRDAA